MENEGYVKCHGNRIMRRGKMVFCLAVWTAVVGGGCFMLGRVSYAPKALVVDTIGRVEKREELPWKMITNAGECCRERNEIVADYNDFLRTPPKILSVTDKEIRFAIRSNEYSLGYRMQEKTEWHIYPMVSLKCRVTAEGPYASLGCGIMAEFGALGVGVMLNGVLPIRETDMTVFIMIKI